LLRKHITDKTEIGLAAKAFISAGKLVPDDVVLSLLKQEVEQLNSSAEKKSILLDGFPRTTNQAAKLGEFFKVDSVLSLDIPHSVIVERLSMRWIHAPSGRTYSYDYNPPKVKGT
jgi:adenylate kinase family enzyme